MARSTMIFETALLPVIKQLLPEGIEAEDPTWGPVDCRIEIEGDGVPDAEYCYMRVWLALNDNVPVRTVMFEAAA
jgi:hypothetical protein